MLQKWDSRSGALIVGVQGLDTAQIHMTVLVKSIYLSILLHFVLLPGMLLGAMSADWECTTLPRMFVSALQRMAVA